MVPLGSQLALVLGHQALLKHGTLVWRKAPPTSGGEYPYTFTRPSGQSDAYLDYDGILRYASANTPRIEFPTGLVDQFGNPYRGPRFDGSRQNLLLQSEAFGTTWAPNFVTVSSNVDTAPDGTGTGDRLVEDGSAGEHLVLQTVTATADVKHAFSVYAKAGTRTWLRLTIRDTPGEAHSVKAWFNLSTGVVGTVGHVGSGSGEQAFIEKLANGWYRCMLIGACNNGDTTPVATVQVTTGDNVSSYTGDGASYISVWGGQFENNTPIPSSYIKTTTVAVTRAADSLTLSVNFGLLNTTAMVRVARPIHADVNGDLGIYPGIMDLGNNAVLFNRLYFDGPVRQLDSDIQTSGSNSFGLRAMPAGAVITAVAQWKGFATGGQTALDVGAGQSAFGAVAKIEPAYGSQTLRVGGITPATYNLYGVLLELIIAYGLFSHSEMSAIVL